MPKQKDCYLKTELVSFRVSPDVHERLEKLKEGGFDHADWLRNLLILGLNEFEKHGRV